MREIKFRAWLNMQEEMLYANVFGAGEKFAGRDCVIMQFTGLLDKNSKEIYEGDIVEYSNWIDETGSQFSNILIEDITKIPDIDFEYCKIIGNRFENPDLLSN